MKLFISVSAKDPKKEAKSSIESAFPGWKATFKADDEFPLSVSRSKAKRSEKFPPGMGQKIEKILKRFDIHLSYSADDSDVTYTLVFID